jgi:hypothetical protein
LLSIGEQHPSDKIGLTNKEELFKTLAPKSVAPIASDSVIKKGRWLGHRPFLITW